MSWDCRVEPELTAEWDELTRAQSPLADAAWIRCFADAFGDRPELHTVRRDGRLVAGIPTTRDDGRLARVRYSLDNEHHPYWPLAGELDEEAAEHVLAQLLDGVEYVFLRRLPMRDPSCVALVAAAHRLGLPVIQLENPGDARIDLAGPDELRGRLPHNVRRDLPRKQRALAKQGHVVFAEHTDPGPALAAVLAECFDVETRGWKGETGSPINRDPQTLQFYGELAQALAVRGRFALFTLAVDDRVVAFEYCLRGGGHIEMLKLSFDPAFAAHSPGQVLRALLLERELERGDTRYYHLGRPSEWKLRWATEVAPLCTLRIYGRGARARAAHLLGPVLRAGLKRSSLASRLHDRIAAWRAR